MGVKVNAGKDAVPQFPVGLYALGHDQMAEWCEDLYLRRYEEDSYLRQGEVDLPTGDGPTAMAVCSWAERFKKSAQDLSLEEYGEILDIIDAMSMLAGYESDPANLVPSFVNEGVYDVGQDSRRRANS